MDAIRARERPNTERRKLGLALSAKEPGGVERARRRWAYCNG
jgi:hypothetical protein